MGYIYEVKDSVYDYSENETLYYSFTDAESDFFSRIEKYKNSLRIVTDIKVINEYGYAENFIVLDRHDTNPNNLKQAIIIHYPAQFEVEGEPLWCDTVQIDIVRKEVR